MMYNMMDMLNNAANTAKKIADFYYVAALNANLAEMKNEEDADVKIAYRNGMKKIAELVITYDEIRTIEENAFNDARDRKNC